MTDHELMPAMIKALERRVDEAERKANDLRSALNILREDAGLPPRSPGTGGGGGGAPGPSGGAEDPIAPTQIKSDSFFNKPQQTAVREYLEMRRAQGLDGPARPREIYDALVAGGYTYSAKDAETALVGLRALLRKRTNIFVKVGDTGAYGLVSWYGEQKRRRASSHAKASDDPAGVFDDDDDSDKKAPDAATSGASQSDQASLKKQLG